MNQTQKSADNQESAPGLRALLAEREREIEILRSGEVADHLQKSQLMNDKIKLEEQLAQKDARIKELEQINSNANKVFGADCDGLHKIIGEQSALLDELGEAIKFATAYYEENRINGNGLREMREALTKYKTWREGKG